MKRYDVAILGGGQAAAPLIRSLAAAGQSVALIEQSHLGGACVNFGCTPSKAVIASARVAHVARRGAEFGITTGPVEVDFPAVMRRARAIVRDFRGAVGKALGELNGVDVINGRGRLAGRNGDAIRLTVDNRETLEAKRVVIDTGAHNQRPRIDGIESVPFLDANTWIDNDRLPKHLAILGGGYIGLEMAQFFCRMGAKVTVINSGPRIVKHEDEDISSALQKLLETEGVAFRLGVETKSVARSGDGVELRFVHGESLRADMLLVATGRVPSTKDIGLETLDIKTDKHGAIVVDNRLKTTAHNVYVAGDAKGGAMFTHVAWDDHRILESQLIGDGALTTDGRVIPYAVFTDPELGRVGLTEREAREQGRKIKVAVLEMADNGKAIESGERGGRIKLVVEEATGQLLGAAVLSAHGGELVASLITLMNARAPVSVVSKAIYIHPTLAQALQSATLKITGD